MRKLLLASAATMGALLVTVGGAQAQPVTQPAPGTIAVHLNGYLQFAIGDFGSSSNTVDGSKLSPYTTNGDARLYSGFDAETLNGIDYGAQIELRTTTSNNGTSAGSNTTATSTAGGAGTSSIYVKRAYGYLGTQQAGFIRLGQGDSAFTLMQTGVLEGFGDGAQWNVDGGIIQGIPANSVPFTFIYADSSKLYATDKVVYLSPSIAGFSLGVGFEPNSNGLKQGTAACGSSTNDAATTVADCSSIASVDAAVPSAVTNRKNTIDAALMYAETVDGFATKANVAILNAAPEMYTGSDAGVAQYGYKDMTIYQAGVQTSYAGLTLGANVKWGSVESTQNDAFAFVPKGARNGVAYIVNATYAIGPYVLGTSFFDQQSAGGYLPGYSNTAGHYMARTMDEYGVAAGGNYIVGKDLSLFLQYMYSHEHQPGNTYLGSGVSGNAQMQLIEAGSTFKW